MSHLDLETGDLLLFTGHTTGCLKYFSCLIEYATHSDFSHIAMVLKDPTFIDKSLKGLYVWESSWEGIPDPQDGKTKLGVQITPLNEIINSFDGSIIISRKVKCDKTKHFTDQQLKKIHEVVYNKPYDITPSDWIGAIFHKDKNPQKTDRFWCSALVGYIYVKCDVIDPSTDWSILRPSDFSVDGQNLSFIKNCYLSNIEEKIN